MIATIWVYVIVVCYSSWVYTFDFEMRKIWAEPYTLLTLLL